MRYVMLVLSLMMCQEQAVAGKGDGKFWFGSKTQGAGKSSAAKPGDSYLYRGDSRPPVVGASGSKGVFNEGFVPKGQNKDLQAHLSHRGDSGYVSMSSSQTSAQRYAYGATGARQKEGYMYVVKPDNLGDGVWVPGKYGKDPAVQRNQEYAVEGRIPASNIVGAYHYTKGSTKPDKWMDNPGYKYGDSSKYTPDCGKKDCQIM